MACVALTSLKATIELEFLQSIPRVSLHACDQAAIKSLFKNLSSLQAFLQEKSSVGVAIKDLETKIRDLALKAEDDIEINLSNFLLAKRRKHKRRAFKELRQTLLGAAENAAELLKIISNKADEAKDTEHQEDSQELRQALREAAENAKKLLKLINIEKECDIERNVASVALTSLLEKIELEFLQPTPRAGLEYKTVAMTLYGNLYYLLDFLEQSSSADAGAAIKDVENKIRDYALKAKDSIEIQLSNYLVAKDREYQEKASQQLHQTIQEAAEKAAELLKVISSTSNEVDETKGKEYQEEASQELRQTLLEAAENAEELLNQEEASQELCQTLREAAENAAELLKIVNREKECDTDTERNVACFALTSLLEKIQFFSQSSILRLKHVSESESVMPDGSSQHSPMLEDKMVGRHNDRRVVSDLLHYDVLFYHRHPQLRLISIVGMVGIGKTTLATSFYEDKYTKQNFKVQGWITMPQRYSKSQMRRDLLRSITLTEKNEIKKGSSPEEQVYQCLKGKRYLIVLDNFWNNQAWDDIRPCFPDDQNGSRVLLTTRHFDPTCYTRLNYCIHNMTLLDPEESWNLFCKILSPAKCMAPEFEKIRRCLVEKCEGLPQSIVVVAECLSKCSNSNIEQEWKKIEKKLDSLGILDSNTLTLSYHQLPQHLKVCFLHFGVFPKRSKIPVKILIRLWIAEGFLNPLEHHEVETQAYWYLQELINRSLVLIYNWSFDGKVKTCKMHGALHSFCTRESQKEGILCAINTAQLPGWSLNAFANSCRWLSFYPHSFDYYVLFRTNNPRSIFFFLENPEMFIPFKLLRVLASVPSSFLQRTPVHLQDLIFLRYLSVTQWFEGLSDIVSANLNLQTLVVSNIESQHEAPTLRLPSKIWELPRLKHLELGNSCTIDPPSVDKENLQTLSWVNPTHCRTQVNYYSFPNIEKLKIFLKDDLELSHTCGSSINPIIILNNLDYLVRLEKLIILVSAGCVVSLPEQSMFPSQLKKLRLSGTNLSERDLIVIGMLPQLHVLKLENAFHGKVWQVAKGTFFRLRFLLLEAKKLEQLMADRFSLPYLERLVLRSCYCLEEIPRDFDNIPTLRSIALVGCCPSVVASAKKIQDRGFVMGNVIQIKILG